MPLNGQFLRDVVDQPLDEVMLSSWRTNPSTTHPNKKPFAQALSVCVLLDLSRKHGTIRTWWGVSEYGVKYGSRLATWLACYRMGNGPRTKNGREMAGEWSARHFSGVFQNGRKMAGQIAGQLKFGDFPGHLPGHFSAILEHPRIMAAGHFAGHFWFWACFPFCSRPAKSQLQAVKVPILSALAARMPNQDGRGPQSPSKAKPLDRFPVWLRMFKIQGTQTMKCKL